MPLTSAAVKPSARLVDVVNAFEKEADDVGLTASPTARTNERVPVEVPSVTLTVIVTAPDCPAAGTIVSVRFGLVPPIVMFALGTTVVLEDAAVTVSWPAVLSASATVKAIPEMVVFELVAWSAMALTVGVADAQRMPTMPEPPAVFDGPPWPRFAATAAGVASPTPVPPVP